MQTVSDCRVSCPTSSASCSTTCFSTFSGCSATGTTSTISSSASACPYNPSSDVPSNTIPMAAFSTIAWWDYGISCAGSCTDFTQPSASVISDGGFTMSVAPASGSASTIASTGPSATGMSTSSGSSAASISAAPSSSPQTGSVTNPTTTTNHFSQSTSDAAGPSCVSASSLPTGVPQNLVAVNITEWCSLLATEGQVVGCDNQNHDGFWLSSTCSLPLTSVALQYYYPSVTMWLNISLASGSTSFTINETECDAALGTVLNGCPPTSGTPLLKYGGQIPVSHGDGNVANFQINLVSDPGDPGNQPGDPGTTTAPAPAPASPAAAPPAGPSNPSEGTGG